MRRELAHAFGRSGLAPALLSLRRLGVSPWITVIGYHRAGELGAKTDYDDGVVDVTPEAFERHIVFLKRWFNVVDNDQMLAFVRGAPLPKNPVLLTFDDGYRDNHEIVLPILRRHGIKATFFIATSYIEQRRLFWWDRISLLVKSSRKEILEIDYPRVKRLPLGRPDERALAIRALNRVIKDHYDLDLPRFLEHVAAAADVDIPPDEERRRADDLLMTWDQVRSLRRAGMNVQSHTVTHRVLQTLPPEALARELRDSKTFLENVLEEPVRSIAYPVGKPIRSSPHIREAVRAAGYELGYSNCTGVNHTWRFDQLDARRVTTDAAESDADFHAMVALPYLAT